MCIKLPNKKIFYQYPIQPVATLIMTQMGGNLNSENVIMQNVDRINKNYFKSSDFVGRFFMMVNLNSLLLYWSNKISFFKDNFCHFINHIRIRTRWY